MKHPRKFLANLIINSMETAGWMIFLFNSKEPLTYGVCCLWFGSLLRKALEK